MIAPRPLAAALALLAAVAAAAPAAAAGEVAVRAGRHDGYDRIVFDWPRPVDYRARIADGALVVDFERAAEFDMGQVRARLGETVGRAAPGPDGRRLTLPLKRPVRLQHFTAGARVVVDLHAPSDGAGPPTVRLRVGEHEGYSRLVFDWPRPVGSALERAGERAVLRFRRPARLDLGAARRAPPRHVLAVVPADDADGAVELRLPEGARLRHFTVDARVVVDVFAASAARARAAEVPGETAPAADLSKDEEAGQTALADAAPVAAPITAAAPAEPEPAAEEVAHAEPLSLLPPPAAKPAPPQPAAAAEPAPVAEAPVPGRAAPRAEPLAFAAPWAGPAAAAFRHGGAIWLVFQGRAPAGLRRDVPGLAAAERIDLDGATALSLPADPRLAARLAPADPGWSVRLAALPAGPDVPLAPRLAAGARRMALAVEDAGPVVELPAGAAAGRLAVALVAAPGRGLAAARRMPQFDLLASHQGVVVRRKADGVEVAATPAGVAVGTAGPLLVSAAGDGPPPAVGAAPPGRRLFDLPAWRRGLPAPGMSDGAAARGSEAFAEARRRLQRAAVEAEPERRPLARLDLARFYFAHGLANEALGALALYARDEPRRAREPQVRLMRAAARLLAGDAAKAVEDLADPALDGEAEATLWRAALAAVAGDWRAAAAGFRKSRRLVAAYPRPVRKRLRLLAAEAHVEDAAPAAAEAALAAVRADAPSPAEAAEADFLRGRLLAAEGEGEEAAEVWRRVAEGPHPAARARARFALIERGLEQGTLQRAEAIARLERLRFAWRGDEFEAALLHRLADLYLAEARYRDGLDALRQAASHFPGSPRAEAATRRMREVFARLYLDGEAEAMTPMQAVALYRAYRELTPPGPEGERMIARLADRLVQVDLLDQAAALLAEQVKHRLSGVERAEAGARLASIRLLDRAPEAALDALAASAAPALPEALARRRGRLEARALLALGRHGAALEALAGDTAPAALRIVAEVRSRAGDWAGAAAALAALAPAPPENGAGLEAAAARRVVHLAVAYTLAEDAAGLDRLARDYGAAMRETALAETFALLAGSGDGTVAGELAAAELARAFLADYRARLQQASLSGAS